MPNVNVITRFFHIRQNNSGGYFIENDYVAQNLIIEAMNAKDAERRMGEITAFYSEFCPCCGARWSFWMDDEDGTDEPTVYGEKIDDICGSTIVHYFDGRTERINY
jgi:hypothetical protein